MFLYIFRLFVYLFYLLDIADRALGAVARKYSVLDFFIAVTFEAHSGRLSAWRAPRMKLKRADLQPGGIYEKEKTSCKNNIFSNIFYTLLFIYYILHNLQIYIILMKIILIPFNNLLFIS